MAFSFRDGVFEHRNLPHDPRRLAERFKHLSPRDRLILEMVLIRGQAAADIARVMDIDAKLMRRHIVRLCRRVTSFRFRQVTRIMPRLKEAEAQVAQLHFCQDIPMRQIARDMGVPIHRVRCLANRVLAKIEAFSELKQFKSVLRA
jgi:DNA-directed RNA polymerase specialized sigma24 family protein